LTRRGFFSDTLLAFLADALVKEPSARPTAAQLLEHQLIREADRQPLIELVQRAQTAKLTPRSKPANDHSETLSSLTLDGYETLRAVDATREVTAEGSGTFCMRRSENGPGLGSGTEDGGGGTLCVRPSSSTGTGTGGTFCMRRSSNTGTENGGSFCSALAPGGSAVPVPVPVPVPVDLPHRRERPLSDPDEASPSPPPQLLRAQSDDAIFATRTLSIKRKLSTSPGSNGPQPSSPMLLGRRGAGSVLSRRRANSDDLEDCSHRNSTWHVEAREARSLTPAEDVHLKEGLCAIS